MPLVSIRNVRKAFGDHVVLHDVNLDVVECSVTVLIGPSGSGKATLLRCLNGLSHPQTGTVAVADGTVDYGPDPDASNLPRCGRSRAGVPGPSPVPAPHVAAEHHRGSHLSPT